GGRVLLQPTGESPPEVEGHQVEVAERGVRAITFGGDLFIEVLKRLGAALNAHDAIVGKRVAARRLIEMAVKTQRMLNGHEFLLIRVRSKDKRAKGQGQ